MPVAMITTSPVNLSRALSSQRSVPLSDERGILTELVRESERVSGISDDTDSPCIMVNGGVATDFLFLIDPSAFKPLGGSADESISECQRYLLMLILGKLGRLKFESWKLSLIALNLELTWL